LQIFAPYRDLLDALFTGQLSSGDQRAVDIAAVVKSMMKDCGADIVMLYPVLAHHADSGNVEGGTGSCVLIIQLPNGHRLFGHPGSDGQV